MIESEKGSAGGMSRRFIAVFLTLLLLLFLSISNSTRTLGMIQLDPQRDVFPVQRAAKRDDARSNATNGSILFLKDNFTTLNISNVDKANTDTNTTQTMVELSLSAGNFSFENGTASNQSSRQNTEEDNKLGSKGNPMTLVIHLSGEMGNHLSKLAYGFGLKWMLQQDYNIHIHAILRHQRYPKWKMVQQNMHQCFPLLRNMSFEDGNTEEFDVRTQQQKDWLRDTDDTLHFKYGEVCEMEDCIRERLDALRDFITSDEATKDRPAVEYDRNITLPFMSSDLFGTFTYFNDRYYHRFRDFFQYEQSDSNCCNLRPDQAESLFHFRNFLVEMPRKGRRFGYEELSPNKTANELFGHLRTGDKLAFTGRFTPGAVENYTRALLDRGVECRAIEGQNNMQDFCFLLNGRKEFGGYTMSSFAVWAAYLGNASVNRLYSIKSPERMLRMGDSYYMHYNWTDLELKQRVSFPLFNSEKQDMIDRGDVNTSLL